MIKLIVIALAALLLSSAAPTTAAAPAPDAPIAAQQFVIHGVVEGTYPSGVQGPIGEYTAVGASLGEATTNAQLLEQQIRAQATAQAVQP